MDHLERILELQGGISGGDQHIEEGYCGLVVSENLAFAEFLRCDGADAAGFRGSNRGRLVPAG